MLYCIIMKGSRTNSKYKDSHKKSEAKHLHAPARPTQFLVTKRHKRAVCLHKNTPKQHPFFSTQPWFDKGGCVPLKPPAFCRGKERHLSDASFPLSPYGPLSPFQRCQREYPFGNPIRKQKGIQTKISKELRLFKNIYTIQVCIYRKLNARLEPKADRTPARNNRGKQDVCPA